MALQFQTPPAGLNLIVERHNQPEDGWIRIAGPMTGQDRGGQQPASLWKHGLPHFLRGSGWQGRLTECGRHDFASLVNNYTRVFECSPNIYLRKLPSRSKEGLPSKLSPGYAHNGMSVSPTIQKVYERGSGFARVVTSVHLNMYLRNLVESRKEEDTYHVSHRIL